MYYYERSLLLGTISGATTSSNVQPRVKNKPQMKSNLEELKDE
jgi:hypothetical protein